MNALPKALVQAIYNVSNDNEPPIFTPNIGQRVANRTYTMVVATKANAYIPPRHNGNHNTSLVLFNNNKGTTKHTKGRSGQLYTHGHRYNSY